MTEHAAAPHGPSHSPLIAAQAPVAEASGAASTQTPTTSRINAIRNALRIGSRSITRLAWPGVSPETESARQGAGRRRRNRSRRPSRSWPLASQSLPQGGESLYWPTRSRLRHCAIVRSLRSPRVPLPSPSFPKLGIRHFLNPGPGPSYPCPDGKMEATCHEAGLFRYRSRPGRGGICRGPEPWLTRERRRPTPTPLRPLAPHVRLCDTDDEMRCAVIAAVVLFSLVAAPFAMALDGCSGMGTICGMSCSAPCASVSSPTSGLTLAVLGRPVLAALPRVPAAPLKTLDAPPKSPLFA